MPSGQKRSCILSHILLYAPLLCHLFFWMEHYSTRERNPVMLLTFAWCPQEEAYMHAWCSTIGGTSIPRFEEIQEVFYYSYERAFQHWKHMAGVCENQLTHQPSLTPLHPLTICSLFCKCTGRFDPMRCSVLRKWWQIIHWWRWWLEWWMWLCGSVYQLLFSCRYSPRAYMIGALRPPQHQKFQFILKKDLLRLGQDRSQLLEKCYGIGQLS